MEENGLGDRKNCSDGSGERKRWYRVSLGYRCNGKNGLRNRFNSRDGLEDGWNG
jgi:hypothetical protein